jgi:hypothetical protein
MRTKRVPPPPQGVVAPPRKSSRRKTTKEKSIDSDDDDEDPLLLMCCGAHSHVTNDCWKLPSNAHKRPAQFAVLDVEQSSVNVESDEEQSKGEESEELVQTGTAD